MTLATFLLNDRQYVRADDLADFLNTPIDCINAFCVRFLAEAQNTFKNCVESFPAGAVDIHMLDTTAFFNFYQDYTTSNPDSISEEDQLAVRYALGEFDARPEPSGDAVTCLYNCGDVMSCEREICECAEPGSITPFLMEVA